MRQVPRFLFVKECPYLEQMAASGATWSASVGATTWPAARRQYPHLSFQGNVAEELLTAAARSRSPRRRCAAGRPAADSGTLSTSSHGVRSRDAGGELRGVHRGGQGNAGRMTSLPAEKKFPKEAQGLPRPAFVCRTEDRHETTEGCRAGETGPATGSEFHNRVVSGFLPRTPPCGLLRAVHPGPRAFPNFGTNSSP